MDGSGSSLLLAIWNGNINICYLELSNMKTLFYPMLDLTIRIYIYIYIYISPILHYVLCSSTFKASALRE